MQHRDTFILITESDYKDNEKRMGTFIQEKMAQWYMEAGAIAVEKGPIGTMLPSTHAYGGTRMGQAPWRLIPPLPDLCLGIPTCGGAFGEGATSPRVRGDNQR
jgi:hypothetical protein